MMKSAAVLAPQAASAFCQAGGVVTIADDRPAGSAATARHASSGT